MVDDGYRVEFDRIQMNGLYDIVGYRRLVAELSNRVVDGRLISEFREAAKSSPLEFEESSAVCVYYLDALITVAVGVEHFFTNRISGGDPNQWLVLRDMVVASSRLVTAPGFFVKGMLDVEHYLYLVAFAIDLMSRVSCRRTRAVAAVKDGSDEEIIRRSSTIFSDIVCGRGGAWIGYIDDMGCQCAAANGMSWLRIRDDYARERNQAFVDTLVEAFGIDEDEAMGMVLFNVMTIASAWDMYQRHCSNASGIGAQEAFTDEHYDTAFDQEIQPAVAPLMVCEPEHGDEIEGYADRFGVSPTSTTFMTNVESAERIVSGYADFVHSDAFFSGDAA